ncbi:MAG: hypothetical protein MJ058_07285 [Akkermansia sp.]|nr:hypothetical protein [Akkermansia sp.]
MKTKWVIVIVVVCAILIVLSCCYYPYILKACLNQEHAGNLGQYGDIYGGLNTLFTGLAFVGLGVTIWLQIKERKGQHIQSCKEDIYKRVSIIKELENMIKFRPIEVDIEKSGEGLIYKYRQGKESIGLQALGEINLALNDVFAFFSIAQRSCEEKLAIGGKALAVFDGLVWVKPWINTLSDLLGDIIEYFPNQPDEIRRYFRLVLNSTTVHAQGLLVLLQYYETRKGLIPLLIAKKYIEPEACLSQFERDEARQRIVMSYIYQNVELDKAIAQIANLDAARASQRSI